MTTAYVLRVYEILNGHIAQTHGMAVGDLLNLEESKLGARLVSIGPELSLAALFATLDSAVKCAMDPKRAPRGVSCEVVEVRTERVGRAFVPPPSNALEPIPTGPNMPKKSAAAAPVRTKSKRTFTEDEISALTYKQGSDAVRLETAARIKRSVARSRRAFDLDDEGSNGS